MTTFEAAEIRGDGHRIDRESWEPRHAATPVVSKRIIVGYGFWIFLLSDIVMFSAFFATYAVLVGQTAGGPSGRELFDLRNTGIQTACLLLSSFTCGLASIGAQTHRVGESACEVRKPVGARLVASAGQRPNLRSCSEASAFLTTDCEIRNCRAIVEGLTPALNAARTAFS